MPGMCRKTGRRLGGWDHKAQSLEVLFTTRFGTRIERRYFGSAAPDLQDRPAAPETILDQFVALAEAIDLFEPRLELQGFRLIEASESGTGIIGVDLVDADTGLAHTFEVPK